MHLSIVIIILSQREDLKSYLPFDMTNFIYLFIYLFIVFIYLFYYKAHELCLMRNHIRNKAKQLPVVYFQEIYIVPFGVLPYYKCISMCFKRC